MDNEAILETMIAQARRVNPDLFELLDALDAMHSEQQRPSRIGWEYTTRDGGTLIARLPNVVFNGQ